MHVRWKAGTELQLTEQASILKDAVTQAMRNSNTPAHFPPPWPRSAEDFLWTFRAPFVLALPGSGGVWAGAAGVGPGIWSVRERAGAG